MKLPIFVRSLRSLTLLKLTVALTFTAMLAIPADAKPEKAAKGPPEKPTQPRMQATLDVLHETRRAPDPIRSLKEAMERLHVAARNKTGYRVEAMELVKKAIAQVEAKNRREADKLIDEAINRMEKGIAAGN